MVLYLHKFTDETSEKETGNYSLHVDSKTTPPFSGGQYKRSYLEEVGTPACSWYKDCERFALKNQKHVPAKEGNGQQESLLEAVFHKSGTSSSYVISAGFSTVWYISTLSLLAQEHLEHEHPEREQLVDSLARVLTFPFRVSISIIGSNADISIRK